MSGPLRSPAVLLTPPTPIEQWQGPEPTPETLSVWKRLRQWAAGYPEPKTSPARLPVPYGANNGITVLGTSAPLAWQPGAPTYRQWSLTPWVRSAIKIRREQIASADWDIVQYDRDGPKNVRLAKRIRNLIDQPNAKQDSFHSFAQELLEDILVLDAGAAEKVRYPSGELAQVWPTPGEFIGVNPRWDGSSPDMPRYYYIPDGQVRAQFRNEDLMYMMDNPRTVSALGISPIEVLKTVIDSELANQHYNRRQVLGAAPDGVLNIGESALPEDVSKAKGEAMQRSAEGGAMWIIGGFKQPTWMPFRSSNRDMQFQEWESLLLRCIATVYGLSPMDLGLTADVNRSTAEQQAENTEDRGLRPLLDLFQRYLTRNIVWDESYGGRANNLQFAFSALNLNETKQKADINKIALGGAPWKTVNEARLMDGRQPLGELDDDANIFNHVLLMTPKGMLDLTKQEYVGEEQLAQLAQDAKTTAATADQNAAAKPDETTKALHDLSDRVYTIQKDIGQQNTLWAVTEAAQRPINVEVHSMTEEPLLDAIKDLTASQFNRPVVNVPAPVVNVEAPVVNVEQAVIPAPEVRIEKGAWQVEAPNVQIDVHVPETKATEVVVNTPAEIAITRMPRRSTKRTVTKRDMAGSVAEVEDVETDA